MAANKDLNRLKVILVEKKKSNLWLSRVEVVYQLVTAPIRNANEDNKIT